MINIANNTVLITAGGTRLLQSNHPETNRKFTSSEECFDWIVQSGWFDRCKAEAIRILKERTSRQIEHQAPLFKQINVALGIASAKQRREIKKIIRTLRAEVNRKEQEFLQATTLSQFLDLLATQHALPHHSMPANQKQPTAKTRSI